MRNMIGQQAVSYLGEVLGTITHQYGEDGKTWAVIDDAYEVCLNDASEVLDLMGVERAKNPALKPSWIRLSPNA